MNRVESTVDAAAQEPTMTLPVLGRRQLLQGGALLMLSLRAGQAAAAPVGITVHRDAACGCCGAWIKYLTATGQFAVTDRVELDMMAIKTRLGVPPTLASCHTARVGKYVIEGHVPVPDILQLLRDRPADVLGLAVPGMVPGSPGMEVPGVSVPYSVISFDRTGRTRVFASHSGRPTRS